MLKILSNINKKLLSYYIIIAFFVLWEVAPRIGWTNPQFMPPLSHVLASAKDITIVKILLDTCVSLKRIIIGFTLSTLLAVPTGFLLGGAFPKISKFFKPLLSFLSQIPPFILFPVFVIIFGIGEKGIYIVILWSAFWPIMFTTISGVQNVDPLLIKSAKSMGSSNATIFFKVIIPAALESIIIGMKTGMSMAFMMLIGAESLGADSGLGWLIRNSQSMGFVPRIYLAVILVAILGLAVNYSLEWLEESIIVWK